MHNVMLRKLREEIVAYRAHLGRLKPTPSVSPGR